MKFLTGISVVVLLGAFAVVAVAADSMEFQNKRGTVRFDHKKHEQLVDDCEVCHERIGAIANFGKAWAHRVCIGCHQPAPGKLEGPVTCNGCHAGK